MTIMSFIQKSDYLSEEYKDYKINVYYDCDCENPRIDYDHLGTIYSAHRDYNPDRHKINELTDDNGVINKNSLDERYIWLPISFYEHGGITIWCGSPEDRKDINIYSRGWDSGFFGFITSPICQVKEEWGWKHLTQKRRKKIEDILKAEIKELNAYFTGECYGVEIEDPNGDDSRFEASWGIIGDDNVKEEIDLCKLSIDSDIEEMEKRRRIEEKYARIFELCWVD